MITSLLTSSLVVFATMTIWSTPLPFRPPVLTLGGERIIEEVYLSLCAGVGDGGSGAWIRLKEPGDRRGLVEVFFLIDKGSTDALEEPVGISSIGSMIGASNKGLVGVSSSEIFPKARGGLKAARVSSNAASKSSSKGGKEAWESVNCGTVKVFLRGPFGLPGMLGSGLEGVCAWVGVTDSGRRASPAEWRVLRRSGVTLAVGGSSV